MVVVATILDRKHRLNHTSGNRRQRNRTALFALAADECREHRGVERDPFGGLLPDLDSPYVVRRRRRRCPSRRFPARRRRRLKHDAHQLTLELRGSWSDRHPPVCDDELARFVRAWPFRVAEVVQSIDELAIGEPLSAPEFERPRKDAWKHEQPGALQALVDQPREGDIVVTGREAQRDDGDDRHQQGDAHPFLAPPGGGSRSQACDLRARQSSVAPSRGAAPRSIFRRAPGRIG